jgi:biofilm PGA synthesis N-glycosyltransferase PgaC
MIHFLSYLILGYFALLWVCYTTLFITSIPLIIRKFQEIYFSRINKDFDYTHGLDVTVFMSVRDGENHICSAIDAVLNNDYSSVFLIVVNDGSSDKTLKLLKKRYQLKVTTKAFRHIIETSKIKNIYQSMNYPHFLVIDKCHHQAVGSAADSHNSALNLCRTPLCITIDADTIIQKDTISQLVYQYLSHPHCVAVGGDIFIPLVQGEDNTPVMQIIPSNPTLGVQVIEYLRSFIYGHEFWTPIGGALCHSGALTLFETQRLVELGGFDKDNFSYDAEIIMRIHDDSLKNKKPYQILYAPAAFAWSIQPKSISGLWAQRRRWQRGLLRSLGLHMRMIFNPRYGRVGLIGMPFYVLFEIFGPVVEGCAYLLLIVAVWLGKMNVQELFWVLLLAWAFIFILSISSLLINFLTFNQYHHKLDLLKILYLNFIDVIFYRPLRAFCALFSSIEYVFNRLRGKPL